MGDLNALIGNEIINGVKQRFNEPESNDNGEQLIDLCARNELRITNTYFPHKPQHKFTIPSLTNPNIENTRGDKSMIDFIIISRTILPTQVKDVRALTSANIGSDHNLILCKIKLDKPPKLNRAGKSIEKYNIESFDSESNQMFYRQRLTEKISANEIDDGDNVDTAWMKIRENIHKAASEAIGKRTVRANNNNTKPWFNVDVKVLANEKRQSYLKYRSNPKPEERQEYITVRNRVNSEITKIKKEFWMKFTKDMEFDMYGTQRKVWKMLKNKKKPVNEFVQTKKITVQQWEDYFTNLLNADIEEETPDEENMNSETISINETEMELFVKNLKNRKAPGPDGISNEMIKYGGLAICVEFQKLFNKIFEAFKIPEEWHTSITTPIFKKGQKSNPGNYNTSSNRSKTLHIRPQK
jgi:hypothetical protein